MSFNEKMTTIANETRSLVGLTDPLGLDDIAQNLNDANAEVDAQTYLLQQLAETVNNLPAAGEGGGGEINLQDKTVTPTSNNQIITADADYDGLNTVTVNAIPSTYVQPAQIKGATTYTPTTSKQTIGPGTYCTGVQTIKGDTNLIAENIKSGVSIFGVNGSYEGSGGNNSGNSGRNMVSVTINGVGSASCLFVDENGNIVAVGSGNSGTFDVSDGMVMCDVAIYTVLSATGYTSISNDFIGMIAYKFQDGGQITMSK